MTASTALAIRTSAGLALRTSNAPVTGAPTALTRVGQQANTAIVRAQTQTALQALDTLELKIADVDFASLDRRGNWQGFFGVAGAFGTMISMAAAMGDASPLILLSGLVPIGAAIAIGKSKGKGPDRTPRALGSHKLEEATVKEIEALTVAGKNATGLERAFLAARTKLVLDGFNLKSGSSAGSHIERTLAGTAALAADCTDDERHEAGLMIALFGDVFRSGYEVNRTGDVANRQRDDGHRIWNNLAGRAERLTLAVEALSPEAREIIAPLVRDTIAVRLTGAPNRWRLARFLDAFDGVRRPWSTAATEISDKVSLRELRTSPGSSNELIVQQSIAEVSIKVAKQRADGQPVLTSTRLVDPALAEQVAAFFENEGLRATLVGREHNVAVVVFEPTADFDVISLS